RSSQKRMQKRPRLERRAFIRRRRPSWPNIAPGENTPPRSTRRHYGGATGRQDDDPQAENATGSRGLAVIDRHRLLHSARGPQRLMRDKRHFELAPLIGS